MITDPLSGSAIWARASELDRAAATLLAYGSSRSIVATLYLRDGAGCWYCGESMEAPTVEHLIPRCLMPIGRKAPGPIWNLVLAHGACQRMAGIARMERKLWLRDHLRERGGQRALGDYAVVAKMKGGTRKERKARRLERIAAGERSMLRDRLRRMEVEPLATIGELTFRPVARAGAAIA